MDDINKRVWIDNDAGEEAEEIYVPATIKGTKGEKVVALTNEGKERLIAKDSFWYCNPPILEGTDDLTSLSHMHEPAVLHNLRLRYTRNHIYSKSGPILIAVNPYQSLPIYSDDILAAYCGESARQLAPHVYAIGDQAFRAMIDYGKNQSILVTGESGAGKTETTKIILQYFATKGKKSQQSNVQEKVLESTPILEAFGNAKTLRNDNSSRFGKFIIVDFDSSGSIVGARLKTYLLEKSRLLHQAEGERNYHIFFELIAACKKDPNVLPSVASWQIRDVEEYDYLNTGGDLDLGKDEAKNFGKTKKALQVVGLSITEIDNICTMLIGILALGNIKFDDNDKDAAIIKSSAREWLQLSCQLLGLEEDALLKSISTKLMTTGKDSYIIPLNSAQAEVARDSLSTLLYETLFLWLVERINESIATKDVNAKHFIGILDIYGFESFKVNSFEQFCINYANEKLQQQFNQHMFKIEQEEYQKEEIDWTYVKFSDNQACITLIEKHLGILSILNEESKFPKATPETFATKLTQKNSRHPYYEKSPYHDHGFIVKHYPGRVEYDTTYFLEKNRNMSLTEYISILQKCKREWMRDLFVPKAGKTKTDNQNQAQASTIASQFKDSLQQLMDTIHQTEANYIRCIKPNNNKKPLEFGQRQVLDQLRCNGVLEAIRIARDGFPTRYAYPTFWNRFRMLADTGLTSDQVKTPEEHASAVKKLMGKIATQHKLEMFQFGKTKLFLKGGQLAFLEDLRTKKRNDAAIVFQKYIKTSIEVFRFKRCQAAVKILQANYRQKVAMAKAKEIRERKASTVMQRYIRMWNNRTTFIFKLNQEMGLTTIQKYIRMWRVANTFMDRRRKIVIVQSRWRGILARKQFHKMKSEALKAANLLHQNRTLLDRIQSLETELLEKSTTLTKVTAEESAKNESIRAALEAKISSYQVEIEAKDDSITQLEQKDAKSAKKLSEWQEKCKIAEKKMDLLTKYETEAKSNLEEKDKAISELRSAKNELLLTQESLKKEIENVRRQLTTMSQEKVKAIEDQLIRKSQDLADLQIELSSTKNAHAMVLKENEEEKKLLQGKLEKLKEKLSSETQAVDSLQIEQQHLTSNLAGLKKELERTLSDFEQEKKFLVGRVEQLQAELIQKSTEISDVQAQNLQLKSDSDNLQQTLDRTKQENDKEKRLIEEKLQNLRRENAEQNRDLTDFKEQLEQMQKSKKKMMESTHTITSKLEEEKRKNLDLVQKYEAELRTKDEEISSLNLEKQQAVSAAIQLKAEENMSNMAREKARFESAISELKDDIAEKVAVIDQMRKTSQTRDEELRQWRQKYTSLMNELEAANPNLEHNSFGDRLKQLENEVTDKNQSISKLELDNQQLMSKHKITLQESSNATREKQRLERELQQLKFNVTERTEAAVVLELKVEQLTTLNKARIQDLEDTKEALRSEKTRSQDLMDRLQREITKSTTTISELQLENNRLKTSQNKEIDRYQEDTEFEKQQLQEELQRKDEELTLISQKFQQLNLTHLQLTNKHRQELDKVTFEVEHEKIMTEKKIKQLETVLEEKTTELQLMQQASHKMTTKHGASSQLLDDMKSNFEYEKKQHQQWREKYNMLKLEADKTLKEQRDAYLQTMQDQREENARLINDLREDFQKKLRAANQTMPKTEIPVLPTDDFSSPALPLSPRTLQSNAERARKNRAGKDRTSSVVEPKSKKDKKHRTERERTSTTSSALGSSTPIVNQLRPSQSRRPRSRRNLLETPENELEISHLEIDTLDDVAEGIPTGVVVPPLSLSTIPGEDRNVVSFLKTTSRSFFRRVSGTKEDGKVASPTKSGSSKNQLSNSNPAAPVNQRPLSARGPPSLPATDDKKQKRMSRGPKPPFPVPDIPADASGMAPEKMIASTLSNISPARFVQFRTLAEAVLGTDFMEFLLASGTDSPALVMSGIPVPSFVLLRYISYVQHLDEKFLGSADLHCLATTLQSSVDQTEKMDFLVPYLNITAVLLTTLSGVVSPPASDYVGMTIQWIHLDTVEPTEPNYPRPDTQSKLQLVFAHIYGKTLHRLMKHIHGELKTHLLTNSPSSGVPEVVAVLLQYLQCFQRNCMFPSLVQQFFTDVFTFMDATIFNETILRKDLCTFSSAFQLKMALEEMLQTLSDQGGPNWLGNMDSWFTHTRQIINCLTLDKKLLCQPEIRKQVCADISLVQLKQMCSLYECEEFENAILSEVITTLMGDPEFDLSQSLLVNVSTVRINTKNIHFTEPTDIQNMGFSQELVAVVLKQIRKIK